MRFLNLPPFLIVFRSCLNQLEPSVGPFAVFSWETGWDFEFVPSGRQHGIFEFADIFDWLSLLSEST